MRELNKSIIFVIIIIFIGMNVQQNILIKKVKADITVYYEDAESYYDGQVNPDGWYISDWECDTSIHDVKAVKEGYTTDCVDPFGILMLGIRADYDDMGGAPAWIETSNTINLPHDHYVISAYISSTHGSDETASVMVDGTVMFSTTIEDQWVEKTTIYEGSITELQLRVYDTNGYTGSCAAYFDNIKIEKINEPPIAEINGPYIGNVNEDILIDASTSNDTDGTIISYEWDLDNDGQFDDASGQKVSWSWSEGGEHPIFLKVTDDDTETDTDTTTAYINDYPIADPNGPYYADVHEKIQFDSSASYDPEGFIMEYHWDFGDGNTSDLAHPTHQYEHHGEYIVGLTVSDDKGLTDHDTTIAVVNAPPVACFSCSPKNPSVNDLVIFNASSSRDLDGSIVSYQWDFGDGETDTGVIIEHCYQNKGNYSVNLTVTDDSDSNKSIVKHIRIYPPGSWNISIDEINGGLGISFKIHNSGSIDATQINWEISCDPSLLGFLLSKNEFSDVIDYLAAGESQTIRTMDFRGIGPMNLMVQVDDVVSYASGFLLGPIMLRVNET